VNALELRAYIGSAQLQAEKGNLKSAVELLKQALDTGRENDAVSELIERYQNRL
jgi:hypothetical protein